MTTSTGSYRTSDLYFAAYLKVASVAFLDTERHRGDDGKMKIWFMFEEQPGLRDLKQQYFSGRAKVSALDMVQAIRWAKQLTHME